MVGRGTVHAAPDVVAEARRRRTDVGMAVVTIHTPGSQHTLHVAIMPWPSNMVHHLVASPLDNCATNFCGEGIQHFVPGRALPLPLAALACALQRIQDALRVVDLV